MPSWDLAPLLYIGPAATEPAADAHDCIMVESSKGTHRIQGCGATFVSPTAGSPQIDGRIRQPTVIGPDHVQRYTLLAPLKDALQTPTHSPPPPPPPPSPL